MSRGTPSAVTTPLRAEAPQPIWLVDITTGGSPANLRFASYDGDVVLGGVTFSARPFQPPEVATTKQSEAGTVELRIADADGYFQTLLAAGMTFGGRRVKLYRTDLAAAVSGSAITDAMRDDYFIEGVARAEGAIIFRLRGVLGIFDLEVPLRTVTRADYPGMPPSGNVL